MAKDIKTPTESQFTALNDAYKYYNKVLFKGILPGCILNFSRKKNTHGFLAPKRWRKKEEENYSIHEISLTPTTLHREPIEVFSTLVHEQAHLWQWEFGKPSRGGYHNTEWADKMEEIGLMPSATGLPGGRRTGPRMTHYIIEEGKYELAFEKMPQEFILPFTSLDGDVRRAELKGMGLLMGAVIEPKQPPVSTIANRNRIRYWCSSCNIKVWGKPNLNIACLDCQKQLIVK